MQGLVAVLLRTVAALPEAPSGLRPVSLLEVVAALWAWVHLLGGHLHEVVGVFTTIQHRRGNLCALAAYAFVAGSAYRHPHLLQKVKLSSAFGAGILQGFHRQGVRILHQMLPSAELHKFYGY